MQESAGALVTMLTPKGVRVLVLARGFREKALMLPGGGMERGETPMRAAVRELQEETGLRATSLRLLATCESAGSRFHVFRVLDYEGELRSSANGMPLWVTPDRLLQQVPDGYWPCQAAILDHSGLL